MNIWFYYAKAGGGHKAPAEALAAEFRKSYPEEKVSLVDLADKAELFFRYLLEDGYIFLIHYLPWLYSLLYIFNSWKSVVMIENKVVDFFVVPSIKAKLVLDRPDMIISTHFFISPLVTAMKELKISIPITMIVTEPFSAPPPWFYFTDINYVVFSEQAQASAVKAGVPTANIAIFSSIINHPIAKVDESSVNLIKERFGLTPGKKTVLIIGGANGLPKGEKIISSLLQDTVDADLVVVCGTNKHSEERMRLLAERYPKRLVVLGFVKNIAELIAVSDLVVSKAGAGVVFETLLNYKPLLITHYIYGQEKGTMEFVVKNNLGWYEPRPSNIAQKVRDCLGQEESNHIKAVHEALRLAPGNHEVANYLFRSLYKNKAGQL